MSIVLDGTTGITTPGLTNTGTETLVNLTTTGNTTLGDATTDTLTVGVTGIVKDSSGNVGIGTASPVRRLEVSTTSTGTVNLIGLGTSGAGGQGMLLGVDTTNSYAFIKNNTSASYGLAFFSGNGSEAARFDSSGNLLVGSTNSNPIATGVSGAAFLSVGAIRISSSPSSSYMGITAASGTQVTFYTYSGGAIAAGTITCPTTNTTSYTSISDHRLKENIVPMTGALAKVAQLKPCTYDWINDKVKGQGFIAHELQAIVPDCVIGEKDAVDEEGKPQYQSIDTSFLVATLTAAIQEQQALITTLTDRITALEAR
jgi:hypothetical protein